MMKDIINIFVSHKGEDEKHIEDLKSLLSKHGNYEVRDSSIVESEPNNAKNTEYIKNIIRPKIEWAGKIIVLIGKETSTSEWVNWEIGIASKYSDKSIIGIFLQGSTDDDIPKSLNEFGDACVTWDSDKIIEAMEGNPIWMNSKGENRPNIDFKREIC
jgi:hypothetical protein